MDNDDLYFSFDEEETGEEGGSGVEAEESQNRTFLIVVGVLGALFVLSLILIGVLLLTQPRGGPAVSENELTNQANMTLFAATQTAEFLTQSAPTEAPGETEEAGGGVIIPTATLTPPPTAVPSPVPATPEETEEAAGGTEQPAEGTEEAAEATEQPAGGTEEAAEATEQPAEGTEEAAGGTEEAVEVTAVSGAPGAGEVGGTAEEGQAGALPQTGFSSGVGLAGAGLAALALIALVVVARRLRLK